MSWLFSQALVAEYSAGTCSDGELCAPLSGSPTPQAFLPSDRMMAFSRPSRFGMTFAPLTEDRGEELLKLCREDFRARTYPLPEREQALTEPDPACGGTWRGSWARFDPASSSWRTAQPSLLGDSDECSVTWPRSGMTAAGQCWELPMWAPPTSATGSGLWPTPTSTLGTKGGLVTPAKAREGGTLIEALSARTIWPTPTVCGNYNRKGASATSGDGLATAVRNFPTPTSSNTKAHHMRGADKGKAREARSYGATGQLNPTWVEWLMGWPLGWTDLKPLGTDRCPDAQPQPGACSLVA